MPHAALPWEVLKVAAYTHWQAIRIHPFVNGNGRATRKCIDYFCWRYGLRLPVFAGKNAAGADRGYIEAMYLCFQQNWATPLIDYLRQHGGVDDEGISWGEGDADYD